MSKTVAFFIKQFTERGGEKAVLFYAIYNETILKNESIIITLSEQGCKKYSVKYIQTSRKEFEERFRIFEIDHINDMKNLILKYKLDFFYTLSHGGSKEFHQFHKKLIWGKCQTIYHAMFGPVSRQNSDIRCVVGAHLNYAWGKNLPVLPHIVIPHNYSGNLREKLSIPKNAFVFGRHGGIKTFDIEFVKESIIEIINKRYDCYFIFLNTPKFYDHERIIHLPMSTDIKDVSKFINTCDAMIHARKVGETFGMACAEFSAANKPVITCLCGDLEHIKILGESAIIYKNKDQLKKIFLTISRKEISKRSWNKYKDYYPEKVMKKFNNICLKKTQISFFGFLLIYFCDIRAEFLYVLRKIKNYLFKRIFS